MNSELLKGLTPKERVQMVKECIKEMGGKSFTAYNKTGNEISVKIAEASQKFKNEKGKIVAVNRDLLTKFNQKVVKQESVILANELIATAQYDRSEAAKHEHGWLDDNGKNGQHMYKIKKKPFGRQCSM